MTNPRIEKAYQKFKDESENFFVTKFLDRGQALKKTYKECLDILFGLSGDVDSGRGIIASNTSYGQGKTFFFDVVQHRFRRTYGRNFFFKTTAMKLCEVYKNAPKNSNPEDSLLEYISASRLFIDDIGDELINGKFTHHYGNKLNVIRWVLLKRYEFWTDKNKKWITYGTTNLTIEQIAENYDGRVADRVLQMTYFREFSFLGSGQSFRQVEETRQLTPQEIAENWKKFEKPKKDVEKIDLEKYFNELIAEPDEYFADKDASFWSFVKHYLVRKKYLDKKDFDKRIDETFLDAAESKLKLDSRRYARDKYKHTTGVVRASLVEDVMKSINKKQVYDTAENLVARNKFMELRESKHVFK